jgi:hypothetical protein
MNKVNFSVNFSYPNLGSKCTTKITIRIRDIRYNNNPNLRGVK